MLHSCVGAVRAARSDPNFGYTIQAGPYFGDGEKTAGPKPRDFASDFGFLKDAS